MCRAERLRTPDRNLSTEQARCRIYETSAGDAKSKKELRRVQDVPLRSACQASGRRPCSLGRYARRLCLPRSCCSRLRLRRPVDNTRRRSAPSRRAYRLDACRVWRGRRGARRVLRRDASAVPSEPLEARPHTPRREESDRGTYSEDRRRCCEHEDTAARGPRRRSGGLLSPEPCGVLDDLRERSRVG